MLISVILVFNDKQDIAPALDRLARQPCYCEVVVVGGQKRPGNPVDLEASQFKTVPAPAAAMKTRFNAGAASAGGDVLLFLFAESHLSADAILVLERNLKLLPQTSGGNFHLKFHGNSLLAKSLFYLLKWWRYRGSYCVESGIFVRKRIFEELGGFRADSVIWDYEFVRRMERYGPTLYLPETILVPLPGLRKMLNWLLIGPILVKLKFGS